MTKSQFITPQEVLIAIKKGFQEDVRPTWNKWSKGLCISRNLTGKERLE